MTPLTKGNYLNSINEWCKEDALAKMYEYLERSTSSDLEIVSPLTRIKLLQGKDETIVEIT